MSAALKGLRAVRDCGIVAHRGPQPTHLYAAWKAGWLNHKWEQRNGTWWGRFTLNMSAEKATGMLRAAERGARA